MKMHAYIKEIEMDRNRRYVAVKTGSYPTI